MNINFASYFVVGFFLVFGIVALIALRRTHLLKLAFRNFSRKKISTLLLIIGSMVGTSLISGSLILNDSFVSSSQSHVQEKIGTTTGIIYPRSPEVTWDTTKANSVYSAVNTDFEKFLPIYFRRLTVTNPTQAIVKNDTVVMSFDKDTAASYERTFAEHSSSFSIAKDQAILSQSLADQLKLSTGDEVNISIINNISIVLKIKDILPDNGLIGFNAPTQSHLGFSLGSVYVSPELLPTLSAQMSQTSQNGYYNALLVSRPPNYVRDTLISIVQQRLNTYDPNIIFEELHYYLSSSTLGTSGSTNFGQILLIVSVFAIIAGLILMINLYYMIADERRGELGTLRAIGFSRVDTILVFIFEGALYSLVSSLVGVLFGILLGWGFLTVVTKVINSYASEFDLQSTIKLSINFTSLIFAFSGAWIVTFLTTLLSSFSIVNVPIVAALRDLRPTKKIKLTFSSIALILTVSFIGAVLLYFSYFGKITSETIKAYFTYIGFLLFLWPLSYVVNLIRPFKIVYQIVALLTIWFTLLLPKVDMFEAAWRNGPYLFILNAVVLIFSCAIVLLFSIDDIVKLLRFISRLSPKFYSVISVGLKYPVQKKFRSGLTMIVFGLVIFIVSVISTLRLQINEVLNKVTSEFDVIIIDQLGKENVRGLIEEHKDEISGYEDMFSSDLGSATIPQYLYKDIPVFDPNAPLAIKPEDEFRDAVVTVDQSLFSRNLTILSDKSPEEVQRLLLETSDYVLLGQNYSRAPGDFNIRPEIALNTKITLKFPGSKEIQRTVIGIIKDDSAPASIETLQIPVSANGSNGILIGKQDYEFIKNTEGIYFSGVYGLHIDYNKDPNGESSDTIKRILRGRNISSVYIVAETIKRGTLFLNQLITLIQGFMAFGLIIGIAGLAVVLIRSIHSRHQEIGMLRSLGFSRSMIEMVFICEALLLTLSGILIGFGSGIFSSYLFYQYLLAGKTSIPFAIPYTELSLIFAAVLLASLLFSYLPARKAGKLSPAEATRYIG
jgi:putative ABC transport system permease protein